MSDPFIGEIRMFGCNFAVRNWSYCAGQLLPISQNQSLFALLGTTYGGDGRSTFGLPDMRGRVPISWSGGTGPGLSSYRWGQRGGAETTTLTAVNLPPHNHSAQTTLENLSGTTTVTPQATTSPSDSNDPTGSYLATATTYRSDPGRGTVGMASYNAPTSVSGSATTVIGNTGAGVAFNNLQPYETVSFQISMQGIFPSRS